MDSTEQSQRQSDERVTFTIRRSTKDRFLVKLFLILTLTIFSSYFLVQKANQDYQKGQELTQEEYLENFAAYKGNLLHSKPYTNQPFTAFLTLIVFSFLIGSYELTALIISIIIGKLIRRPEQ